MLWATVRAGWFSFGSLCFVATGCALTVSYDGYDRSEGTDAGTVSGNGGSTGIGGGSFGGFGGSPDAGGSGAGAGGCREDGECPPDDVCRDHFCDGTSCQVTNLVNEDCAPSSCTGPSEVTPS